MSRRRLNVIGTLFATVAICCLWSGCAGSGIRTMIHETSTGKVYLEWVEKESFRASHPVTLSPHVIRHSLRGVLVQHPVGIAEALLGKEPSVSRMFSHDDVEFLLPHIISAFSQATPEERVVFQRMYPLESESRMTAGTLHIHKNLLFLTFTQYGKKKTQGPAIIFYKGNRPVSDPSGLKELKVSFTPKALWRHDIKPNHEPVSQPYAKTLVLAYKELATLPPEQTKSPSAVSFKERMAEQQSQTNRFNRIGEAPETTGLEEESQKEGQDHGSKEAPGLKSLEEKFRVLREELSEVEEEIEKLKKHP